MEKKMRNSIFLLAPYGSFKFKALATKVGGGKEPQGSDARCKKEIQLLTTFADGMKIYSFQYIWSNETFVGVMAQDLLAHPEWKDAVSIRADGFYAVDYSRLGLRMTTLELWNKTGIDSVKAVSTIPLNA